MPSKPLVKVGLSFGTGKLHFLDMLEALHKIPERSSLSIHAFTGGIPPRWPKLINAMGRLIGEGSLYRRVEPRIRIKDMTEKVSSFLSTELLQIATLPLNHLGKLFEGYNQYFPFLLFGYLTAKHMDTCDIFHVRSGAGQAGAIREAKKKGAKIIVDHSIVHPIELAKSLSDDTTAPISNEDLSTFWKMVLDDCTMADLVVVNSDYVAQTFIEQGFAPEKLKVLYWGVNEQFIGLKTDYEIKAKPQLLFTGRFEIRKGALTILEALSELRQRNTPAKLVIVGTITPDVQFHINNYPFQEDIQHVPFVPQENLKKFFIESDMFVFPTLAEGCSRSVMEALGSGLPVITTEQAGAPCAHGKEAFLVPIKSAIAVADAIAELSANKPLRQVLGSGAAKMVQTDYTWLSYTKNLYQTFMQQLS